MPIQNTKTWFITGATRGIGYYIAKKALEHGENVVLTGRNVEQVDLSFPHTGKALCLTMDVTKTADIDAAVAQTKEHFGRIDVLVNNAGYGLLGIFEAIDAPAIMQQFNTNVFGLMDVTRAVLPIMREQRAGKIFNLSSVGGSVPFEGAAIYCASKFAVEGFSASLAPEVAQFGIDITIVEPGFFRTDFLDPTSIQFGTSAPADYQHYADNIQQFYSERNHQQAGDPVKLAETLLTLANENKPPLYFAAGSDAFEYLGNTFDARKQELLAWKTLTVSTDLAQ